MPPSAASGGIPDPTGDYLTLAAQPPLLLSSGPRRILVVLDLNGTLLHRPNPKRPRQFVARPHARRFLRYCLDTFVVAIWSSARRNNVLSMIDTLIPDLDCRRRVVVAWSRDNCGLSHDDYTRRVQIYKRLSHLWADPHVRAAHPLSKHGKVWSQLDTVLVDDSSEKARSEPHNLICIPEYEGGEEAGVEVIPQVHDYLNILSSQHNISSYIRSKPFQLNSSYIL